jgi:hypothetical protein
VVRDLLILTIFSLSKQKEGRPRPIEGATFHSHCITIRHHAMEALPIVVDIPFIVEQAAKSAEHKTKRCSSEIALVDEELRLLQDRKTSLQRANQQYQLTASLKLSGVSYGCILTQKASGRRKMCGLSFVVERSL